MLAPLGRGEDAAPLTEAWGAYERSAARREQSASTLASKRVAWVRFAAWLEEVHPEIASLDGLTADATAEYVRVFRIGRSAGTVNNHICALREIWRCVASSGGADDPWANVRLLPEDCHARREFSLEELERIADAVRRVGFAEEAETSSTIGNGAQLTDIGPSTEGELRLLFAIGMHTGLRLGDCCLLSWDEADLERGLIQVVPRKTRRFSHGRPVTIPIHPALGALLAESAACLPRRPPAAVGGGYVMPKLAEWYLHARWKLSKALGDVFAAAGIQTSVAVAGRARATPDATFHSLRHTFVSFAANAGVPLPVVASIVGHSSTAMTRHYYHESEEALRRAVEAVPEIGCGKSAGRKIGVPADAPPALLQARREHRNQSPEQRLRRLAKCLEEGLVTQEEYSAQRAAIIASI